MHGHIVPNVCGHTMVGFEKVMCRVFAAHTHRRQLQRREMCNPVWLDTLCRIVVMYTLMLFDCPAVPSIFFVEKVQHGTHKHMV